MKLTKEMCSYLYFNFIISLCQLYFMKEIFSRSCSDIFIKSHVETTKCEKWFCFLSICFRRLYIVKFEIIQKLSKNVHIVSNNHESIDNLDARSEITWNKQMTFIFNSLRCVEIIIYLKKYKIHLIVQNNQTSSQTSSN